MTTHPTMTSNTLREELENILAQWFTEENNLGLLDRTIAVAMIEKLISKECDRADRGARIDELNRYEEALQTLSEDALFNYSDNRLRELTTPERKK